MRASGESSDHYEQLQISRNATALIVTKAYRLLAAIYHPDNKETGNEETFRRIVDAHTVLTDPVRRAAYDRHLIGATTAPTTPGDLPGDMRPSEVLPGEALGRGERELRQLVLHALYTARRNRPGNPAVPLMVLLELLGCSVDDVQFTLWYLRGKKLIETQDDGAAITVAGVDHVEQVGEPLDGDALPPAPRRSMLEARS